MWQEEGEEDVRSYWINLRTGEDTLIWRRRLWIALCGGIVLEETLDLSSNRLLNNNNNNMIFFFVVVPYRMINLLRRFGYKCCRHLDSDWIWFSSNLNQIQSSLRWKQKATLKRRKKCIILLIVRTRKPNSEKFCLENLTKCINKQC